MKNVKKLKRRTQLPFRLENMGGMNIKFQKIMKSKPGIDCHKCKHYYVTWDKRFPHGCRAMKFKGKALPSVTVFSSSNMLCQLFAEKHLEKRAVEETPKKK
jgi:hypothetical protein